MWGANSESAGTNSITGVDGAGPAKGVKSDGMSNIGGALEVGNYGFGCSVGGGGGGAAAPSVPNKAEEKKKKSKSFWKGAMKK